MSKCVSENVGLPRSQITLISAYMEVYNCFYMAFQL